MSAEGKTLFVANAKGFGAGPNGGKGFQLGPEGTYIGDITKGTISITDHPQGLRVDSAHPPGNEEQRFCSRFLAAKGSRRASGRSPDFPVPLPGSPSSRIRHVVFITKENRTFDEVLGDLGGAERGDATLARWGMDATVKDKGQPTLEHVQVTPNEHALAKRFAFSDNFYVDSDVSADGHHWLVDNYPNELLETAWPAAYGGKLEFVPDADAPGRLEFGGTSTMPETYLENGSLWENLARAHITFRNYGEGNGIAGQRRRPGRVRTRLAPVRERAHAEGPVREHLARLPHLQYQHLRPVSLRPVQEGIRRIRKREEAPAPVHLHLAP